VLRALRKWQVESIGSDRNAINKIKQICRQHVPPVEYNDVDATQQAREKFAEAKVHKCSMDYVYKQGPDKKLSDLIMTKLPWQAGVSFPYNLKGDVAEESDDD
jgi:hypothetical protein